MSASAVKFCASCGNSVGAGTSFCTDCGASLELTPEVHPGDTTLRAPSVPPSRTARNTATAPTLDPPTIRAIGVALIIAGLVLLFAKAGFPPKITTTYRYSSTGGISKTTSPSYVTMGACVGLLLIGGALAKPRNRRTGA